MKYSKVLLIKEPRSLIFFIKYAFNHYNSGYKVKVADTVGAGDSFLGSFISQLVNHVNPQEAINFACAVGALVAQSEGANPNLYHKDIVAFMDS